MKLSQRCRQDRACLWCEGEWFQFAVTKSDILYDFLPKERWVRRRFDPNWISNE